jgi:hypothetical protein
MNVFIVDARSRYELRKHRIYVVLEASTRVEVDRLLGGAWDILSLESTSDCASVEKVVDGVLVRISESHEQFEGYEIIGYCPADSLQREVHFVVEHPDRDTAIRMVTNTPFGWNNLGARPFFPTSSPPPEVLQGSIVLGGAAVRRLSSSKGGGEVKRIA